MSRTTSRLRLSTLCLCLGACRGEEVASDVAPPEPSGGAEVATVGVVALAAGSSAPMPRPYRMRRAAAVASNAACVACHTLEAAEWRGSGHQRADVDPAYRAALEAEPNAFCRGCHAPESDPTRAAPKAESDLGVGCVTCHVTEEGSVLAAAASTNADADEAAPHVVRRSVAFGGPGACAGCHEFAFPMAKGAEDGQLMQTTVREHERSPGASRACAACHMPARDGHRSHAFASVRDPAWLSSKLHASAAWTDDGAVRVTLAQSDPGHAFPTGDLFRRLEVGCELRGAEGKLLGRDVRYLARHFEVAVGRPGRQLVRDDRVQGEPSVVELACEPAAGAPRSGRVAWWVSYQRVATVGMGTSPGDATIESEVRLHSGVLLRAAN